MGGTVIGIASGDTVLVQMKSSVQRVRLISVDTPASRDPSGANECLEPQATEELRRLLPDGEAIKLEYGDKTPDKYGRTSAAVFLTDGRFVNAEIARAGLGIPVSSTRSSNYLNRVRAAQRAAFEKHRGFFDPHQECTVAARQRAILSRVEKAMAAKPKSVAEAKAARANLAKALADLKAFTAMLSASHTDTIWLAYTDDLLSSVTASITTVIDEGTDTQTTLAAEETQLQAMQDDSGPMATSGPASGATSTQTTGTGSSTSAGSTSNAGAISSPTKGHKGKLCGAKGGAHSKKC